MDENKQPLELRAHDEVDFDRVGWWLGREDGGTRDTLEPPPAAVVDPNAITVGDDVYTVQPMSNGDDIIHLSRGQAIFLHALVKTMNPEKAAKEAMVPLSTAWRWFKSKRFLKYFEELKLQTAQANGLTVSMLDAIAVEHLIGKRQLDRQQQKTLDMLYRRMGLMRATTGDDKMREQADSFIFVASKGTPTPEMQQAAQAALKPQPPIIDVGGPA